MSTEVVDIRDIVSLVESHDKWRLRDCLNLQCSENITSDAVRKILASDMGHRYTLPINQDVHGSYVSNAYRGTWYMDEVESEGEELAKEVFGADHAMLKPLSGHIAGMMMLLATCRKRDRILVIDAKHGGYDGYLRSGMPGMFSLKVDTLPFDESCWNLDTEAAVEKIESLKPRLIVIGASFILFPYDMKALADAAEDAGSLIGYDGSHVLGLIAGHEFQRPLQQGADVLVGSTHKSLFGPQGGILMCNDEKLFEKAKKTLFWQVMDNAHWNRIAALTQALSEARKFGASYARQVIKNARTLAKKLDDKDVAVKFSYLNHTECHQIHLDEGKLKEKWGLTFNEFADGMERNGIILDAVGRIGTNELTRLGAREKQMAEVSELIAKSLAGVNVSKDVLALRSQLKMKFCMEPAV